MVGLGLLSVVFDVIQGGSSSSSQLPVAAELALAGGVLVAIGALGERDRRRVIEEGLSSEATVTAVKQRRFFGTVRIHEPSWMIIRYRYQDAGGRMFEGRDLIPEEEAQKWDIGDKAMIRFAGRRPSTSAWIGKPSGPPAGAGSKRHVPQPPPSWFRLAKRVPSVWIGSLLFIAGVVVLVVASVETQYEQGTVLRKSIERAGDQRNPRYSIVYRFATRDGQVIQGHQQVSVATWESLHENDPVRVQYHRGKPIVNRLYRRSGRALSIITPGIYLLPGLLIFLAGLRRVWIWHRLVGHGVRATGTVSAVKWAMFADGGWGRGIAEWQRIIRYCYEDESGHAHQGRSGFLSSPEASRSRVGGRCDIRIDRERPASSVWIGAVD